ncbi:Bug family tripartite tricarboxylate transporter substrate binding protein [Ramlibacter tataouinensis]|uniref:Candidate extracytoplasmic binding receptor n=1 Tax=Ramlibacter tataouinensis (strain ATCC BAA-407 / DSM 14655 / LMG 21543 / TTB310) TaxID=365046 RepID=F5Y420_RAMTT|nr:tripartite tricarboxylate transporter substrate binding protein [Ramlibacter tataouinensis]AEG91298.1 Candidate extracytoplasmic binding receptor [Ramlibacter tataouinensis TTB310]
MNDNTLLRRRELLASACALAAAGLAAAPATGFAQAGYPTKPIRLVIPFAPGGVTDTSGRAVAEFLGKRLGQQVVPDNRPGASGNIGSQLVASAEPDGHTLLLVLDGTFVINPHVYEKVAFDPVRDFAPVGKIGNSTIILVANPGVKARTLKEVVALSKSQPGGLSYGTSGNGSITHIAGELLKQRTGANLTHVPYKGGGPAVADVLAGHIPLAFASAASITGHLKSGKLVPIGVPSARRSPQYPDIPTFAESGAPDFDLNSWVGIVAPAKTPAPILQRLNAELNAVLNDAAVREKLAASGIAATPGSAESFGEVVRKELAAYGPVVKGAGIKAD